MYMDLAGTCIICHPTSGMTQTNTKYMMYKLAVSENIHLYRFVTKGWHFTNELQSLRITLLYAVESLSALAISILIKVAYIAVYWFIDILLY